MNSAANVNQSNCTQCNFALPADSQFCPECGHRVGSSIDGNPINSHQQASAGGPALNTLGSQPTYFPSQQQPTSSNQELEPGETFANRYEIEKLLGRGGMGSVYLAKDEVSGRQVAIKILNNQRMSDSDARRLIDEGMLARDIRHRNVVAVYDADIFDGMPYMTMEYIEGSSLREMLRQKQAANENFSIAAASSIISQVLDGLQAAHQAQVVHRDLKPENIMVNINAEGELFVRILDFGIAKNETQSRDSGSTAGTLGYMSPEQFTSADLVGPSSDIYSVSVIFYELLVGALPRGHWQPPSDGREEIPKEIDKLIERGLSNRAMNRPQNANDFRSSMSLAFQGTANTNWQNGVAELGKSLFGGKPSENGNNSSGLSGISQWWNSLTTAAKAWVVIGIIVLVGMIGVAADEMNLDDSDWSDGSQPVQMQDSFQDQTFQNPTFQNQSFQNQSFQGYGEQTGWPN